MEGRPPRTKAIDLVTTGPDAAVGERQARQSSSAPRACKSSACNRGDNRAALWVDVLYGSMFYGSPPAAAAAA